MSNVIEFKVLLAQIDAVLDQCRPEESSSAHAGRPTPGQHAHHQALLNQAVDEITEGLALFPFNPQLLRRRAWARAHIRTADGEHLEMHLAVEDLQLLLEFDPNDLSSALELLQDMHQAGGMPVTAVAQVASEVSSRLEDLLIRTRILQMRALLANGDGLGARQLYDATTRQFSDSSKLRGFKSELQSAAPGSQGDRA